MIVESAIIEDRKVVRAYEGGNVQNAQVVEIDPANKWIDELLSLPYPNLPSFIFDRFDFFVSCFQHGELPVASVDLDQTLIEKAKVLFCIPFF